MDYYVMYRAYTTGSQKDIGIKYLHIEQEALNDGTSREFVRMTCNDGFNCKFYPAGPDDPIYEEIRAKASPLPAHFL